MDINGLERIKSSRVAIAAGLLVIAAGGAAYFYFVYQPEMQSETVAAKPPVARKPPPAPAKLAAKPVQPTVPASGVPTTASPGVSPAQQPVTAPVPSPVVPDPEMTAEPAKPEPVAQKDRPKRRKAATSSKPVTEPAQVATMDNKPDTPDISEQVAAQTQDVLLAPAPVVSVSIAPVESVPVAPVEPAPVESAPVASAAPPQNRGPITPKYNDVMTAVLRGDREAAKELLDLGWWVDKPSANGVTPLVAAVMNRDAQMVQLLLEYGAEPTSQALRLARKNKDAATAALLEQKGAR
jgi:hypothetical protein